MKSRRRFQSREIKTSFFRARRAGVSQECQQTEMQRKPYSAHFWATHDSWMTPQ
jgi:hypothetical protein